MSQGGEGRDRWLRVEALFDRLVELPAEERCAGLEASARDDPSVAAEVQTMLEADDAAGLLDGSAEDLLGSIQGAEPEMGDPALGQERALEEAGGPGGDGGAKSLPETIGGYRILGKLGEGGMGVVFEAEQTQPRRRVALKVVRGGHRADDLALRMFEREADTLARLEHPNIGAIYDAGRTDEGRPFIALELVRGDTLEEHLAKSSPELSEPEVERRLRLFASIARAVHYAHQRGVIHRDLKPSNIVVTDRERHEGSSSGGGLPHAKILDFGLARLAQVEGEELSRLTTFGMVKGTLPYMSPEQAAGVGEDLDVRTDVYSLGVILYEMLAGRRPYHTSGLGLVEAARVIAETPPVPLREGWRGRRGPDADLTTIVGKALAKNPDDRYGSAGALAEDVERFLGSQPILARPPSTLYQIRKLVARHRIPVAVASAVLLLVLASAVGLSFLYVASERNLERALLAELIALGRLELESSPSSALAYAIASLERDDDPTARRFALEALWRGPTAIVTSTVPTSSAAFSPDGEYLAFGRANFVEQQTDLVVFEAGGGPARVVGPGGAHMPFVGFDPAVDRLLSKRNGESVVRSWSLPHGEPLVSFPIDPGAGVLQAPGAERLITFTPSEIEAGRTVVESIDLATGAVEDLGDALPGVVNELFVLVGLDAAGTRIALPEAGGAVVVPVESLSDDVARTAGTVPGTAWPVVLTLSPTGSLLIENPADTGELRLWRVESGRAGGELLRRFSYRTPSTPAAFDPAERYVAAGGPGGEAWFWDLEDPPGASPIVLRRAGQQAIWKVVWNPRSRWLATSDNGGGTLWPIGRRYATELVGHAAPLSTLAFDPEGEWLLSGSGNSGEGRLWRLSGGEPGVAVAGSTGRSVVAAPSSERVLMIRGGGFAELAAAEGSDRRRLGGEDLWCGAFSPDGRLVAVGGGQFVREEALVRLWDLENGRETVLDAGDGGMIVDLHFLGDGRLVASGKGGLRLWSFESGVFEQLSEEASAYVAVSGDDRLVFVLVGEGTAAGQGGRVVVHDLVTGDSRPLTSHGARVNHLAVSPDGAWIATGDLDGTIRVGPVDGSTPHLLLGHRGAVNALAFDPKGRWLASAGVDTIVRLWPLPEGPPLQTLPTDALLGKLRALTNFRVVADPESRDGYRVEVGPFPGWETVPIW